MVSETGEPLRGAVSHPVKVGATVRRDAGPWTPSVHALLQHLRDSGFDGVPRPLGFDDDGREILEFVDGVDGRHVTPSDPALSSAADLIRRFHDACGDFPLPPTATWNRTLSYEDATPEIVANNDLAPYNTIFRGNTAVALIDWDFAAPASRLWDLANAVWSFAPLYPDDLTVRLGYQLEDRGRRLRLFCDTYDLDAGREPLLNVIGARLARQPGPRGEYARHFEQHRDEWARELS